VARVGILNPSVTFAPHNEPATDAFGKSFAELFAVPLPFVSHAARSLEIVNDLPRSDQIVVLRRQIDVSYLVSVRLGTKSGASFQTINTRLGNSPAGCSSRA
jgi:hypothetical protein